MSELNTLFSLHDREGLSNESPTPLYFQLYSLLKERILNGTLSRGERLPTEQQLAEVFGISRITVKHAMDKLAAEDLVERRRGRGTHVTYEYSPQPIKAPLLAMLQGIESMARRSRAIVQTCEMLQPPALIRDQLELAAGDTALYLVRLRERDGIRFGHYASWTAGVKMPRRKAVFEQTPRLAYFREHGLDVTHVTQTISAVAAPEDVATALDMRPGSPVLSLVRRSYNKDGDQEHLRDYLHALYNPAHFQYKMDLELD